MTSPIVVERQPAEPTELRLSGGNFTVPYGEAAVQVPRGVPARIENCTVRFSEADSAP